MARKRMRPAELPGPWREVRPNESPAFLDKIRAMSAPGDEEANVRVFLDQRIYVDGRYTVFIRDVKADDGRPIRHLSIKRDDRGMIDDWRVLQAIKNEFAGPEIDAVQVFPRESHLVDTSNQWHLWCYMDGRALPFGYKERQVGTPAEASALQARQRPFA